MQKSSTGYSGVLAWWCGSRLCQDGVKTDLQKKKQLGDWLVFFAGRMLSGEKWSDFYDGFFSNTCVTILSLFVNVASLGIVSHSTINQVSISHSARPNAAQCPS